MIEVGQKRKRGGNAKASSSSSKSSSNKRCNWIGPLGSRAAHLKDECGYTVVACPLAAFGCLERPERRSLAAHAADAALKHVELLTTYATQTKAQLDRHEKEIATLEKANAALVSKLANQTERPSSSTSSVSLVLPIIVLFATPFFICLFFIYQLPHSLKLF